MKKILLLFVLTFALMISSLGMVAANDIIITPDQPGPNDDLRAVVEGYETATFDWFWQRGSATYYSNRGTSSTLDASYTEEGQTWIVYAYVPNSAIEYNNAQITIEQDNSCPVIEPIADITVYAGDVVAVTPEVSDADGDDRLATFRNIPGGYTWVGPILPWDSSDAKASWTWTTTDADVGAYGVWVDVEDQAGCTVSEHFTVRVLERETVAPQVTDITFSVTEGDLVDVDVGYVEDFWLFSALKDLFSGPLSTSSETVYVFDGDSPESDITYEFDPTFFVTDVNEGHWQTAVGDAGLYNTWVDVSDADGNTVRADITVRVKEQTNTCPVVTANDVTVTEGELLTADFTAVDANGDSLVLSYSTPLVGGDWQTGVGDAGTYTLSVTADDGTCTVTDTFTATVLEQPVIGGSNYEGDKLYVNEVTVLNANELYSAYNVAGQNVITSGVFYVDNNDFVQSTGSSNYMRLMVELYNKNSFDARDLEVTFIFNGEKTYSTFQDLDRGEKGRELYSVPIPNNLETGKYTMLVIIENDDLYNVEPLNLDIVSLGDYVEYENKKLGIFKTNDPAKLSLWEKIKAWFTA